jgi:HD-like signal output (HDOD) protein
MNRADLEKTVASLVHSMPPSDQSVEKLLEAARDKLRPEDVAGIVATDPSLCADLLYLANSPCWRDASATEPIETIEDALSLVGIEPLCMLVGPLYVRHAVKLEIVSSKHWHDYEQHSLEISLGCRTLSGILGMSEHDQQRYCAAGLTHDIGRAVIMLAGEPQAGTLVGTSPDKLNEIVKSEEEAYGMNHCHLGERLFKRWRVSKIMSEGILRHHTPMVDDDFCLPGAIIFVSHFLTMSDFTGEIIANMLPRDLLDALHLGPRDIDKARKEMARYATSAM